jgi:hypothetical protein
MGLASIATEVAKSAVIGHYEDKVGFALFAGAECVTPDTRKSPNSSHLQKVTSLHCIGPFIVDHLPADSIIVDPPAGFNGRAPKGSGLSEYK